MRIFSRRDPKRNFFGFVRRESFCRNLSTLRKKIQKKILLERNARKNHHSLVTLYITSSSCEED